MRRRLRYADRLGVHPFPAGEALDLARHFAAGESGTGEGAPPECSQPAAGSR